LVNGEMETKKNKYSVEVLIKHMSIYKFIILVFPLATKSDRKSTNNVQSLNLRTKPSSLKLMS